MSKWKFIISKASNERFDAYKICDMEHFFWIILSQTHRSLSKS